MVVAADVKNIDNMLLIPAGCTLTERQLNILKAWGVDEIEVENCQTAEDADPLAKFAPEEVARMADEIKSRFWQPAEAEPVFAEIVKLMLHRHARNIVGQ